MPHPSSLLQSSRRSLATLTLLLAASSAAAAAPNVWKELHTFGGATVRDLAFPNASVGYVVGELGMVWKTTDGGATWTLVMGLGFPYYWSGVAALSETDVVVSGFNNATSKGILRWSHDGGATWGPDVVVNDNGWLDRIRFADPQHGIAMDYISLGGTSRQVRSTSTGGATAADWSGTVADDPMIGGWASQFTLLPNGHAFRTSGEFCKSLDYGATWTCSERADPAYDGGTFFLDDNLGWVSGGGYGNGPGGWVRRTTDGGTTWSARTLAAAWPIWEILFLTPDSGWAVGGDANGGTGGMYFSADGGQTWNLDFDTGYQMNACTNVGLKAWCIGYTNVPGFSSKIYTLDFADTAPVVSVVPLSLSLNVTTGASDSAPIAIANTGGGTLTFAITEGSHPDTGVLANNDLFDTIDSPGGAGNWLIRTTGVSGGAGDCSNPSDAPWLSATPTSGEVAAGNSQDVTVTVDAAALAEGTYSAQLCMTTNDPDSALIAIPVSVTVDIEDRIFADEFEMP